MMKKKMTFFLGSPRKNGNTAHVIRQINKTLEAKGIESETVFLPDYDIRPCKECFSCQKDKGKPACRIKDDMKKMFKKIKASDVIVFAAPVFCWSFAAQIKPFIDRFFCLGKYDTDPIVSLIEGKKCAIVITAGGDGSDGANLMSEGMAKMADFFKMKNLGELVIAEYTNHEILKQKAVAKKITSFAGKLIK
jgi:multimeric flavodoxin WrbA